MVLIVDTREQAPLTFSACEGVSILRQYLPVGDYSTPGSKSVVERKSVADLYSSFTSNYDAERAKILKAKELNLKYILGIEASATELRKGHSYWSGGEMHESKKSGISMIRQLMTITHKYGVEVWFTDGKKDLAFRIMEYFLAEERLAKV